jgi:hypothetical protein
MLRSVPGNGALRKLSRREIALIAVLAVAALAAGNALFRRPAGGTVLRPRVEAAAPLPPVPRIGLDRLDQPIGVDAAGERDLFAYGGRAGAPPEPLPTVIVPTPPPAATASTAPGDLAANEGPAALPPLNLRFIGSVESARGVKVAILVTDRREVLTGQAGEVVANRYRIARIGLESVDLEDVGTGQSRRIPLRGGS